MPNALKKIRARAKQLQKKHPNSKWTSLIKEASKDYRAGKLGSVKKRSVKRHTGSTHKRHTVKHHSPGTGLKQQAEQKFAAACLAYEKATTRKATIKAAHEKSKWRKVMRSL